MLDEFGEVAVVEGEFGNGQFEEILELGDVVQEEPVVDQSSFIAIDGKTGSSRTLCGIAHKRLAYGSAAKAQAGSHRIVVGFLLQYRLVPKGVYLFNLTGNPTHEVYSVNPAADHGELDDLR